MVYRFTFLSDEVDGFTRVIEADSEASFLDLHQAILDSVGYPNDQMTSFFLCNDEWEKGQEITLVEMASTSEYDNLVMESTKLDELLGDEGQKLLYVFDPMYERAFFGNLSEIIPGKTLDKPVCTKKSGKAPQQVQEEEDLTNLLKDAANLDADFYGDQDYDADELDEEGFSDMNFDEGNPVDGGGF